jgi:hypothetical protein
MAAFLDRTTYMSVLNNSTEQHSTLEFSQASQKDLNSSEGKRNDAVQFLFPDDRFWSIVSIVGGLGVAATLAVAHHAFLHWLHGRNMESFPQVWIKGANNSFANIFSIFVGLSAGSALTQIVRLLSCFYIWLVCLITVTVVEMASFRQRAIANAHYR